MVQKNREIALNGINHFQNKAKGNNIKLEPWKDGTPSSISPRYNSIREARLSG